MKTNKFLLVFAATFALASCGGNQSSATGLSTQADTSSAQGTTSAAATSTEESTSTENRTARIAKTLHTALQSYTTKDGIGIDVTVGAKVNVPDVVDVEVKKLNLAVEGYRDRTQEDVVIVEATEEKPEQKLHYFKGALSLGIESVAINFAEKPAEETSSSEEATSEESVSEAPTSINFSDVSAKAYLDGNVLYANTENAKLADIASTLNEFSDESVQNVAMLINMASFFLGAYNNKVAVYVPGIVPMFGDSFNTQSIVDGYDTAMNALKSIEVDQVESIVTLLGDYINFTESGEGYIATVKTSYDTLFFFASMIGPMVSKDFKNITKDDLKNYLPGLNEEGSLSVTFDNAGISNIEAAIETGIAIKKVEGEGSEEVTTFEKVADIKASVNVKIKDCTSVTFPDFADYTKIFFPEEPEETSGSEEEVSSEEVVSVISEE